MNRRQFIAANLIALPMAGSMINAEKIKMDSKNNMVKFYCPRWGASDSWDSFCKRVQQAGYNGIEAGIGSLEVSENEEMLAALQKYNLELIGQYWQSYERDFPSHLKNYEAYLNRLATLRPIFINAQTGKDFFTIEENKKLIAAAKNFTKQSGITVVHETHRGKALFAAPIAKQYLEQLPDLRLTLDISHWCNVHESLLQDQSESVNMAISRTNHIHSRVGYQEGPQVNDPRADEWKEVVNCHLAWWDKVVELHRSQGTTLTITTEFGPPGYMPTLPYTQQPVASQWDINVYMMNLLKKRYSID